MESFFGRVNRVFLGLFVLELLQLRAAHFSVTSGGNEKINNNDFIHVGAE